LKEKVFLMSLPSNGKQKWNPEAVPEGKDIGSTQKAKQRPSLDSERLVRYLGEEGVAWPD
jgi:hypothetical protein